MNGSKRNQSVVTFGLLPSDLLYLIVTTTLLTFLKQTLFYNLESGINWNHFYSKTDTNMLIIKYMRS